MVSAKVLQIIYINKCLCLGNLQEISARIVTRIEVKILPISAEGLRFGKQDIVLYKCKKQIIILLEYTLTQVCSQNREGGIGRWESDPILKRPSDQRGLRSF